VVVDLRLVRLMRAAMARVEAPSKPLAPNSTSADFSSSSRISALGRRWRTLAGTLALRSVKRKAYSIIT
jgi:hypothetical protein